MEIVGLDRGLRRTGIPNFLGTVGQRRRVDVYLACKILDEAAVNDVFSVDPFRGDRRCGPPYWDARLFGPLAQRIAADVGFPCDVGQRALIDDVFLV